MKITIKFKIHLNFRIHKLHLFNNYLKLQVMMIMGIRMRMMMMINICNLLDYYSRDDEDIS